MAQIELDSCPDDDRAIELWQRALDSDTLTVAAQAWLSFGRIQQYSAPITAAHAFEQAMLTGDTRSRSRHPLKQAGDASAQPARARHPSMQLCASTPLRAPAAAVCD
ncbi:MAG: hypothetical protein LC721_06055, partial [Actinobacteria bacterium]|nr:hypothetical protein [Actinomycetota bacterium]